MKKFISKLFILIPALLLSGCNNKSTTLKKNYLSGIFQLKYAASLKNENDLYSPYFRNIKKKTDYTSLFDLNNSFFNFKIEIENNKAKGVGEYAIILTDSHYQSMSGSFEYYCGFSEVYGDDIFLVNGTKPESFEKMFYRTPNWWVRLKIKLPEISEDNIYMEFNFTQANEYPPEFDHHIW